MRKEKMLSMAIVFGSLSVATMNGHIQFPNPDMDIFFTSICAMISAAALMAIVQQHYKNK